MNKYLPSFKNGGWFKKSRSNNRVILLHGSLAHIFDKDQSRSQISADRFIREIASYAPISLLLGSPYVSSFIHETIHLSGKELEEVDSYKLPFNKTSDKTVIVSSIKLNKKKALTIHSRLNSEGADLLNSLGALKIKALWQPAILTLVQSLLSFSSDILRQKDYLIIYFQEEILRARWSGSLPEFQNFHYYRPDLNFDVKKRYMETLLSADQAERKADSVVFDRLDNISDGQSSLIDALLYPRGKKSKLRSSRRVLKKNPEKLKRKITLNQALAGLTACVAVWALVANLELFKAKREYLDAQKNLAKLRERSKNFALIAETERAYFRLSSFWESAAELRIKPDLILSELESALPPGIWVYRASTHLNKLVLELLGGEEADLNSLVDSLNRRFGKTSLENSETALFDNTDLKKHRLTIELSSTSVNNEKMDKK